MAVTKSARQRHFALRARRFATELPCRYREAGSRVWYEGLTVNISVSGVLFRAAQALQSPTAIEMTVALPAVLPGAAAAEIRCRGLIVRNATATDSDPSTVLAASITGFRVVRRRQAVARHGVT